MTCSMVRLTTSPPCLPHLNCTLTTSPIYLTGTQGKSSQSSLAVIAAVSPLVRAILSPSCCHPLPTYNLVLPQFEEAVVALLVQFVTEGMVVASLRECSQVIDMMKVLGVDTKHVMIEKNDARVREFKMEDTENIFPDCEHLEEVKIENTNIDFDEESSIVDRDENSALSEIIGARLTSLLSNKPRSRQQTVNIDDSVSTRPVLARKKNKMLDKLMDDAGGTSKELNISPGIDFSNYKNIPVCVTGDNDDVKPQQITQFSAAGLCPLLRENVTKSGYKLPTPVQMNAIPIILAGRDLMCCAETGSGKTAAFLLPIIQKLISSQADSGIGSPTACPQALVITPTRKLALQIYNEAKMFALGSMVKPVVACGGIDTESQERMLGEGCNILVTTLRRLLVYVGKGKVSFSNIQFLVLDEADRLFDFGFFPELCCCLNNPSMPTMRERQTLMFSKSFPDDLQKKAQDFLYDYFFLTVGRVGTVCREAWQTETGLRRQ